MSKRKFLNNKDIVIIAVIFALGAILYALFNIYIADEGSYGEVIYDGKVIAALPLNENREYIPDVNENIIIEVSGGKICFKHSDCPDKICVNTGWISKSGQTAVCLPNKLSIIIKSNKNNDIDTVL